MITSSKTSPNYVEIEIDYNPSNFLCNHFLFVPCCFRSIFIPSSNVVSSDLPSSIELQTLVCKMARIHDKLCQIYFKINQYVAIMVFMFDLIQFSNSDLQFFTK